MTDELRAQVSAFLDEELHDAESELFARRLCADDDLRSTLGRFVLIGDAIRAGSVTVPSAFAASVTRAIDGEAVDDAPVERGQDRSRWSASFGRPAAAAGIAAAVAIAAVLALRTTSTEPPELIAGTAQPSETVPAATQPAAPVATTVTLPASAPSVQTQRPAFQRARISKYLITHSEYTGGREGLLPYRRVVVPGERTETPRGPNK